MPEIARTYSLAHLRGLTALEVRRLGRAGIETTADLLAAAPDTRKERSLARKAGVPLSRMREAVNRADLVQVRGMGPATADLFENAGVNSTRELARRNPEALAATLAKYVERHPELNYRLPNPKTVATLVERARALTLDPSAPSAERAAADLKAFLPEYYQAFAMHMPGTASLEEAQAAVSSAGFTEVQSADEDPHAHDLSQFRVFTHPDVVFPGSDTRWFAAYERASGKLEGIYDFN